MANGGWYGTKEEWDRLEAPLLVLDDTLREFAVTNDCDFSKNHKSHPERSLSWGRSTRCLIQIFLVEEANLAFNFWICASEDRALKRFWKQELLKEKVPISEINRNLPALLQTAKQKLDY